MNGQELLKNAILAAAAAAAAPGGGQNNNNDNNGTKNHSLSFLKLEPALNINTASMSNTSIGGTTPLLDELSTPDSTRSNSPVNSSSNTSVMNTNNSLKPKRWHGASCHQCKTAKDPSLLFFCCSSTSGAATFSAGSANLVRKRRCRKKYCDSCLKRSYSHNVSINSPNWLCPSCLGFCVCAACGRSESGVLVNNPNLIAQIASSQFVNNNIIQPNIISGFNQPLLAQQANNLNTPSPTASMKLNADASAVQAIQAIAAANNIDLKTFKPQLLQKLVQQVEAAETLQQQQQAVQPDLNPSSSTQSDELLNALSVALQQQLTQAALQAATLAQQHQHQQLQQVNQSNLANINSNENNPNNVSALQVAINAAAALAAKNNPGAAVSLSNINDAYDQRIAKMRPLGLNSSMTPNSTLQSQILASSSPSVLPMHKLSLNSSHSSPRQSPGVIDKRLAAINSAFNTPNLSNNVPSGHSSHPGSAPSRFRSLASSTMQLAATAGDSSPLDTAQRNKRTHFMSQTADSLPNFVANNEENEASPSSRQRTLATHNLNSSRVSRCTIIDDFQLDLHSQGNYNVNNAESDALIRQLQQVQLQKQVLIQQHLKGLSSSQPIFSTVNNDVDSSPQLQAHLNSLNSLNNPSGNAARINIQNFSNFSLQDNPYHSNSTVNEAAPNNSNTANSDSSNLTEQFQSTLAAILASPDGPKMLFETYQVIQSQAPSALNNTNTNNHSNFSNYNAVDNKSNNLYSNVSVVNHTGNGESHGSALPIAPALSSSISSSPFIDHNAMNSFLPIMNPSTRLTSDNISSLMRLTSENVGLFGPSISTAIGNIGIQLGHSEIVASNSMFISQPNSRVTSENYLHSNDFSTLPNQPLLMSSISSNSLPDINFILGNTK
jgi:hypothetical protein